MLLSTVATLYSPVFLYSSDVFFTLYMFVYFRFYVLCSPYENIRWDLEVIRSAHSCHDVEGVVDVLLAYAKQTIGRFDTAKVSECGRCFSIVLGDD